MDCNEGNNYGLSPIIITDPFYFQKLLGEMLADQTDKEIMLEMFRKFARQVGYPDCNESNNYGYKWL